MSDKISRADYLQSHPKAAAWAALKHATEQATKTAPGIIKIPKNMFLGKRALIIGAGVSGLTTAYELLSQQSGMEVTILEAQNRTGGRCLSLRTGDTLTEDTDSRLFNAGPGPTQTIRFKQPVGDSAPYLNAGPGRIPSSHKHLLRYLRDFGVDVEIYVMNSESNLVQMKGGPFKSKPVVYRRLNHNVRGWIAQMVYEKAETLLKEADPNISKRSLPAQAKRLKDLMVSFGELDSQGQYDPDAGPDGFEEARGRAGFDVLPGVDAGVTARAIKLDTLLKSEFWKNTKFYQPSDFLWQPTLFQPVGGMDQVQKSFAREIAALGATVHLNSPVKKIEWDETNQEFVVSVEQIGTKTLIEYRADYCFSNMAIPFLSRYLSESLQSPKSRGGFDQTFKAGLQAVYKAQFKGDPRKSYSSRFLAMTTKVGWQADRKLWQGVSFEKKKKLGRYEIHGVPESEEGVVPIFGGISWTDHDIVQIWYPSTGYHDQLGVLTGAYNFSNIAYDWGKMPIDDRLNNARKGARGFGKAFAAGLKDGVAIAWQNMPYIKGGWAVWQTVDEAVDHFNHLTQGSGITNSKGDTTDPVFFIVGDQLSSLPGWQEGAIVSALQALNRLVRPDLATPHLSYLPDTKLMVEGI